MGRVSGILIVAIAAAILVSGCGVPSGRVSFRGGPLYLDGDIGASGKGSIIQGQTSTKDLDLDDPSIAFQPKAEMFWGGLNLSLDAMAAGYEGTGIATVGLGSGDDPPVQQGAIVDTELALAYVMLKATWDFIPSDVIDVGIGLGGGVLDYDLSVEETRTNGSFESDKALPVIYPVLRVGTLIGPVRIVGYLGGIGLKYDGDRIRYIDGELYAGVRLFGEDSRVQGWVSLGYRYIDFAIDYTSDDSAVEMDATLSGPYLSFEITF